MTQNMEQNSGFRTREAQEDSLTYHLGGLQAARNYRLLARAMIQEAEARGAAEQRRKDTEEVNTKIAALERDLNDWRSRFWKADNEISLYRNCMNDCLNVLSRVNAGRLACTWIKECLKKSPQYEEAE